MKDYSGMVSGRLKAIRFIKKEGNKIYWLLQCSCGREVISPINYVVTGDKKSCGCLHTEHNKTGLKNFKHGDAKKGGRISLYSIWQNMRRRCYQKNNKSFINYGGRGITVINEWNSSYKNFKSWAIKNGYQNGLTIERINNNGNYTPQNCCFIPLVRQALNKRNTRYLEYNRKKIPLSMLAKEFGINQQVLRGRLELGWPLESALKKD